MVSKGDPTRLLTACASCHGVNGLGGTNETPALAGQVKDYFIPPCVRIVVASTE
jgi:cytochrome c553